MLVAVLKPTIFIHDENFEKSSDLFTLIFIPSW